MPTLERSEGPRSCGRYRDSDGDPRQAAAPQSRAQHPRRELQAKGQASIRSTDVTPAADTDIGRDANGRLKGRGWDTSKLAKMANF